MALPKNPFREAPRRTSTSAPSVGRTMVETSPEDVARGPEDSANLRPGMYTSSVIKPLISDRGVAPPINYIIPGQMQGKIHLELKTAKVDNVRLPRSGGGSVRFLPKKLGKNNKRSMDLAARQGDKSRADQPSHTDSGTVLPQILKNGNQSTIPRSGRVVKQGGSGEDSSLTRSVSGTPLPSSKKRRVIQTGVQHERTKPICTVREVQDGGRTNAVYAIGEKRLDDKNRSQRCLLLPTHSGRTQEIVQIQVEQCPPAIPGMSIRVGLGPGEFSRRF